MHGSGHRHRSRVDTRVQAMRQPGGQELRKAAKRWLHWRQQVCQGLLGCCASTTCAAPAAVRGKRHQVNSCSRASLGRRKHVGAWLLLLLLAAARRATEKVLMVDLWWVLPPKVAAGRAGADVCAASCHGLGLGVPLPCGCRAHCSGCWRAAGGGASFWQRQSRRQGQLQPSSGISRVSCKVANGAAPADEEASVKFAEIAEMR